jgi:hypothetical protein
MSYNPTEITTTKISDLPKGNYNSGPNTIKIEKQQKLGEVNTTYQNLNVHPNPFIPEGGYELPSRDIPQNTQSYNIDPEIKANYVPPSPSPSPPRIEDYLRDTEIITNRRIKKHQEKQKRKSNLMDIIGDFQFTIYLSLLFLLLNLPIINTLLGRFNIFFYEDGNINFYGLIFKSAIFGIIYYIIQKTIDYIVV